MCPLFNPYSEIAATSVLIHGYLEKPAPLAFRGTLRGVVY